MPVRHRERHRTEHTGWLRAAVLGANDGIDPPGVRDGYEGLAGIGVAEIERQVVRMVPEGFLQPAEVGGAVSVGSGHLRSSHCRRTAKHHWGPCQKREGR
jgi:hypothetical protein